MMATANQQPIKYSTVTDSRFTISRSYVTCVGDIREYFCKTFAYRISHTHLYLFTKHRNPKTNISTQSIHGLCMKKNKLIRNVKSMDIP